MTELRSDRMIHIQEIVVILHNQLIHAYKGYAVYRASHKEDGTIHQRLGKRLEQKFILPDFLGPNVISPEMSMFRFIYLSSLSNCTITICRMMEEKRNQDTFFDVIKKAKKLEREPKKLNFFIKKVDEFKTSEELARQVKYRHTVIAHNAKDNIPINIISDLEFCMDKVTELVDLCIEIFFSKAGNSTSRKTVALASANDFWSMFVEEEAKL